MIEYKMWKCPHPQCGALNETALNPCECHFCGTPKPAALDKQAKTEPKPE